MSTWAGKWLDIKYGWGSCWEVDSSAGNCVESDHLKLAEKNLFWMFYFWSWRNWVLFYTLLLWPYSYELFKQCGLASTNLVFSFIENNEIPSDCQLYKAEKFKYESACNLFSDRLFHKGKEIKPIVKESFDIIITKYTLRVLLAFAV